MLSKIKDAKLGTTPTTQPPKEQSPKKRLLIISCILSIGGLLFGYDTGVISGAILTFNKEFNVKDGSWQESIIVSSLIIGAIAGSYLSGRISDKFGRRKNILIIAFIFAIGAAIGALSPNEVCFMISRFILGLAVGGASCSVPVYISEISPANTRSKLVTINELMIVTGQLLAYTMNAGINSLTNEAFWTWRVMIIVGTIPAVLFWFSALCIPETPRWYIANDMPEKARSVLSTIRNAKEAQREIFDISKIIEKANWEKNEDTLENEGVYTFPLFKNINTPWIRRLLFIGVIIAISQQITGIDTIMYYFPTILKTAGFETSTAITATILNGVVSVLATFFGIWQLGKRKRKSMLIIGQTGIILSLCSLGLAFSLFMHTVVDSQGNVVLDSSANPYVAPNFPLASYIILTLMLCFLVFQQGFVSPVTWLILSEIFPTKIRGLSMGISTAVLWSVKFCVVFLFPVVLAKLGGNFTFLSMGFLNIIIMGLAIKFVPETSKKSLEQLENEFRGYKQ